MEITCDKCGQTYDFHDEYAHFKARHDLYWTEKDFKYASEYFDKYPHHKYHRGEWIEYLNRNYPTLAIEVMEMDDETFVERANEFAIKEANHIRELAREATNEYIKKKLPTRTDPWYKRLIRKCE